MDSNPCWPLFERRQTRVIGIQTRVNTGKGTDRARSTHGELQFGCMGAADSTCTQSCYEALIQIGDDQARSRIVAGTRGSGSRPRRIASYVDQRQVGFWMART